MKRSVMRRLAVVALIVFFVLANSVVFSANRQTTRALASTTATCSVKWRLPQSVCENSENCSYMQKMSENGYLYAVYGHTLAVLKPDGQLFGTYDVPAVLGSHRIWIDDYVPFSNEYILFESEGAIYKYILGSQTIIPVTFQRPAKFMYCNAIFVEGPASLFRVGQSDNVLACLSREVTSPHLSGVDLVTFNQQSLSITTIRQSSPMIGGRSWSRVRAGQDGFVYLEPNAGSTSLIDEGANVVAKYNLKTQQWSIIRLPEELNRVFLRLSLVDSASNLYFEHYYGDATTARFRLIKVSPSGQTIWIITEREIGSTAGLIGILSNGNPIMSTSSKVDPAGLVECTFAGAGTLSPTPTFAPTFTPSG